MASTLHTREQFLSVWPRIREEVVAYAKGENLPTDAVSWFERNLEYNTAGGKLNRGMSVVDTLAILKGRQLEGDDYFKAAVLGWCVELLQAYFLVADDMMDQSITRRGQPCWYKVEEVGNIAINDSFMLEAAIYRLLRGHFRTEPYYVDLLELFHETTIQTELGQLVDLITAPEDHVDLSKFSLSKHHTIVVYKTAYYSFYLPVALAMRMHGMTSPSDAGRPAASTPTAASDPFKQAADILIPLGEYFQVQDDYLDAYGDPKVIGKIGTDILDNKCSWNINIALKHATPEQRKVLDEHYGRKDAASEAKVKEVFASPNVDVARRFQAYETESYQKLNALIDAVPEAETGLKRDVFRAFLAKVYKRSK